MWNSRGQKTEAAKPLGFPLENSSVLIYIINFECIFFVSEFELEKRN